jgi:hypothetical protein
MDTPQLETIRTESERLAMLTVQPRARRRPRWCASSFATTATCHRASFRHDKVQYILQPIFRFVLCVLLSCCSLHVLFFFFLCVCVCPLLCTFLLTRHHSPPTLHFSVCISVLLKYMPHAVMKLLENMPMPWEQVRDVKALYPHNRRHHVHQRAAVGSASRSIWLSGAPCGC